MAQNDQMDRAAQQARAELERHWEHWNVYSLAVWWEKWYPKAGHNRLARHLLDVTGVKDE
ncbi:MAG TPA: hypothetical protein VGJ39_10925 [Vicinamibacterales bacterium]|jgi:hypothetical protein